MEPTRVVLHIGLHKTGSTSIQRFLRDESDGLLAGVGAEFPRGLIDPNNHLELQILAARPGRRAPEHLRHPETLESAWLERASRHVRDQVAAARGHTLVYSSETLSFLRYDDEIGRLAEILAGASIQVVVFLREPVAFLKSYTFTQRILGIEPSPDPESIVYVEPDTWLVDYPARIAPWRALTHDGDVTVIDYDEVLADEGSVIPAFARVLGIRGDALPDPDRWFLNRTEDEREKIRRHLSGNDSAEARFRRSLRP